MSCRHESGSVSFCSKSSSAIGIAATNVIVMSGNAAQYTWTNGHSSGTPPNRTPLTFPGSITLQIPDECYQQKPAGNVNTANYPQVN